MYTLLCHSWDAGVKWGYVPKGPVRTLGTVRPIFFPFIFWNNIGVFLLSESKDILVDSKYSSLKLLIIWYLNIGI